MSVRRAAWLLFAMFALTLPFPAIGPFGGFVPAVHHVVLLAATVAIAVAEGAAGPVLGILLLFAFHAAVTLVLTALAAWLCARLLASRSPAARRTVVWAVCAVLLAVSLAFEIYQTPFGRAPTANLLGVF